MKRRRTKTKGGSNKMVIFVVAIIFVIFLCAALNKPRAEIIKGAQETQNDCKIVDGVKTCLSYY
ncbi:MAG: hypothetical protein WCO23_05020 [bacterium]